MVVTELLSVDSTNSWLALRKGEIHEPCLVYALEQTAGRGQRGNSWEAETGKNLLASVLSFPEGVKASAQFSISEAVALAVVDLLEHYGVEAKVKWPNDIYVRDSKICGILIENSILGANIVTSIAGIGININQTIFLSDAPNPVSLSQITGAQYNITEMAKSLAGSLEKRFSEAYGDSSNPIKLHEEYMKRLWRNDGKCHTFRVTNNSQMIMAAIADVAPDGILTLNIPEEGLRSFAFKEVEFIIDGE